MAIGDVIEENHSINPGPKYIERNGQKINIPMSWTPPTEFDAEVTHFLLPIDNSYSSDKKGHIRDLNSDIVELYHFANEGRRDIALTQANELEDKINELSDSIHVECETFLKYIKEIKDIYKIEK